MAYPTPKTIPMTFPQGNSDLFFSSWFTVQILAVLPSGSSDPTRYQFQEVDTLPDGTLQLKENGVFNDTDLSPAYVIDGGSPGIGSKVLARRGQVGDLHWDILAGAGGTPVLCVDNYTRHVDYSQGGVTSDFPFEVSYSFSNAGSPGDITLGSGPVLISQFAQEIPRNAEGVIFGSMVLGALDFGATTLIPYGAFSSVLSLWIGYGPTACDITWVQPIAGYPPLFRGRVDTAEDAPGQLEGQATLQVWWNPNKLASVSPPIPADSPVWVTLAFEIDKYNAITTGSPYSFTVLAEEPGFAGTSLYFMKTVDGGCTGYPGETACGSGSSPTDICCSIELAGDPDLSLTVTDGSFASDSPYTLAFKGGSWQGEIPGSGKSFYVSCTGDVWTITDWLGNVTVATAAACSPFLLTFPASAFPGNDGTDDITVEIV